MRVTLPRVVKCSFPQGASGTSISEGHGAAYPPHDQEVPGASGGRDRQRILVGLPRLCEDEVQRVWSSGLRGVVPTVHGLLLRLLLLDKPQIPARQTLGDSNWVR